MEIQRIADVTLEHISSDGSGSEADVEAFKDACYAYARAHRISEREAIEVIYGDGAFGERVQEWGPDGVWDDDDYEVPLSCSACGGALVALGALGRVAHFRCRNCGLDSSFDDAALALQLDAENDDPSEQPY